MINLSKIKRFDLVLFAYMMIIIIIGLTTLYSLSLKDDISTQPSYFTKQLIFFLIGLFLFLIISFVDYRTIKLMSFFLYILTIILLVFVFIVGKNASWINLGIAYFQPAELAKIAIILMLAKFWQKSKKAISALDIVFSFIIALPLIYLIIIQPDFGSAMVIVFIWMGIFLLKEEDKKRIIGLFLIILLVSGLVWSFFLKDYQKQRILTFFNPASAPLDSSYQVSQSIIAVGSGKIFGRGFGLGPQSQLNFLPASQTDFIFSVIAEELGFLGAMILILFYALFLYKIIKISTNVYDNFSIIICLGTALYFFIQIIAVIGMNIGITPVVGLPLPLVSYGGSSLLVSMLLIGFIESIVIHQPFTKNKNTIIL